MAVAKVDDITFDCVLHDSHDEDLIRMKPLEFPKPMYGLAITPKRGEPGITFYRQVQGRMILDNDDAWAVINLTHLFRRLSKEEKLRKKYSLYLIKEFPY